MEMTKFSSLVVRAYSVTLLTGFLFWQVFIVVLFTSKVLSAIIFTVGEKARFYQTYKIPEINEAIHIILMFPHTPIVVSESCCGSRNQTKKLWEKTTTLNKHHSLIELSSVPWKISIPFYENRIRSDEWL